jgi:hypothetical protein
MLRFGIDVCKVPLADILAVFLWRITRSPRLPGFRGAFGILLAGRIADVDNHGLGNLRGNLEGRALTKSIAAEPLSNT